MWDQKLSSHVSVLEGSEHHHQPHHNQFSDQLHNKKDCLTSQASDSGFLSGPQTFDSIDVDIADSSDKHYSQQHYQQQQQQSQQQLQQSQQSEKQQQYTVDSGVDLDGASSVSISDKDLKQNDSHMILDGGGIESGLAEWFCTLKLNNSSQLNNLNYVKKTPIKEQREKELQAKLWQLCYQQDDDGDTQLHVAIINGMTTQIIWEIIKLAPAPWLLDMKNDYGSAPIHIAAFTRQSNVIRRLLIAGAKASIRDKDGNTPLHIACMNNDIYSVEALTLPILVDEVQSAYNGSARVPPQNVSTALPCTETLEQKNFLGENAVHIAAQRSHIDILRHLVWCGADINAREGLSGYTPLHYAVACQNIELITFLLKECLQIDIETKTYGKLSAYQLALSTENHKSIDLLEKFGCKQLSPPQSDISDSDDSDYSFE